MIVTIATFQDVSSKDSKLKLYGTPQVFILMLIFPTAVDVLPKLVPAASDSTSGRIGLRRDAGHAIRLAAALSIIYRVLHVTGCNCAQQLSIQWRCLGVHRRRISEKRSERK